MPIDVPTEATTIVDSDWGGDSSRRKSTTGYTILISRGVIFYKTKFQFTIV